MRNKMFTSSKYKGSVYKKKNPQINIGKIPFQNYFLFTSELMQSTASSVRGIVAEMRKIQDYQVLWRKRDSTATLSRRKHPYLCLDRL